MIVRLVRFVVIGLNRGWGWRNSTTLALDAEKMRGYAAALGYTPEDIRYFMDRGVTWERTKFLMTLGERPWESGS